MQVERRGLQSAKCFLYWWIPLLLLLYTHAHTLIHTHTAVWKQKLETQTDCESFSPVGQQCNETVIQSLCKTLVTSFNVMGHTVSRVQCGREVNWRWMSDSCPNPSQQSCHSASSWGLFGESGAFFTVGPEPFLSRFEILDDGLLQNLGIIQSCLACLKRVDHFSQNGTARENLERTWTC